MGQQPRPSHPESGDGTVWPAGGDKLLLSVEDDHIVISLPRRPTTIADLVVDLTHDELVKAFDWGPDQGRESVE